MVGSSTIGLTTNRAPASRQARAVSASSTVPAPTTQPGAVLTSSRMISTAPGTVMVSSMTSMPPARSAATSASASSPLEARTTGKTPSFLIRCRTSLRSI
jgi:hypothetical protein